MKTEQLTDHMEKMVALTLHEKHPNFVSTILLQKECGVIYSELSKCLTSLIEKNIIVLNGRPSEGVLTYGLAKNVTVIPQAVVNIEFKPHEITHGDISEGFENAQLASSSLVCRGWVDIFHLTKHTRTAYCYRTGVASKKKDGEYCISQDSVLKFLKLLVTKRKAASMKNGSLWYIIGENDVDTFD